MPDPMDLVARRFSRFADLPDHDLDRLAALVGRAEPVEARRMVFAEGRRCRTMYLLVEGWVAEHRLLADGGRQILRLRLPGEMAGVECMAYGVSLHGVQTLTRCRLAAIAADEFTVLRRDHPRIVDALFLMGLFERAVSSEWAVSLGRRPAWSRIAHLLLELAERCTLSGMAAGAIPFPLTQQDVADCTGLTIGYVNRVLRDMRGRGMVDLQPHELVLRDADALARHAGFRARYLHPAPDRPAAADRDGADRDGAGVTAFARC